MAHFQKIAYSHTKLPGGTWVHEIVSKIMTSATEIVSNHVASHVLSDSKTLCMRNLRIFSAYTSVREVDRVGNMRNQS